MQHELTQRERFILLALMVHEPPTDVTNTALKASFGLDVGAGERENLAAAGYLTFLRARSSGQPYLYELTAAGRERAVEELAGSADPKSAINLRVVYALFNAVHRFLQRNHVPAEAVFNADRHDIGGDLDSPVGDAVAKEYGNLAEGPGAWVPLRALRDALPNIDRGELDDTLKLLLRRRVIRLTSEANRRTLSEADKAAALNIGGDDKHWMAIA
ncbi:hypothetical protein [Glycomyces albidus]|uniref:Uncharacterized protein n=1 Tax=Glycomyces albidus TaxID=2656774 RepID=A0A6L5GGP0_9ACTN|nr:hypothetical protein [Glycomyces albidus]MQM28862.1 hypothetical protein [Glycomyces albidus]